MSARTTPPFRADHVGSLLRPAGLRAAREDFAAGRIPADQLRATEDAAIADVVRMQENVGLQSATDGEFRRASWHMDFIYQLEGISKAPGNMSVQFHNAEGDIEFTPAALHIDGKLGLGETIFAEPFRFLRSVAEEGQTPKLTIPSPSMVHYRGGRAAIDESVYPDLDDFWRDLTGAYADEVARLGELG
jgi:5-methyltetrahydropteroyltriglutamate--homocysteine methyltransferase